MLKIAIFSFLALITLTTSAQDNLIGRWTAHSIILRNSEIQLEQKEKLILKKDSSYIRRYSLYKSKADTTNEVIFSTTFFNSETSTVVKDKNGNIVKPRWVKESGRFQVDKIKRKIYFTTGKDKTYFKTYELDRKTLYFEESTEGIIKSTETVYLLKLKRRR